MKYEVIHKFYDKQDKDKHVYNVGDIFPKANFEVNENRFKELLSNKNSIGKPLIKKVKLKEEEKEQEDKDEQAKSKPKKSNK